jgi:tetratricopeptide (TPR) repeat protein
MIEPARKFPDPQFSGFSWFSIMMFLLFLLFNSSLRAQRPDSAALFSQLRTSDESKKLEVLQKIYTEYYCFFPVQARPYILQSLALSKKLKNKEAEVAAYYAITYYYSVKGFVDSAFYFANSGLELSQSIHSRPLIARGYGRLGEVFRGKNDMLKAIGYLKKAIEFDPANKERIANYSQSLGIIYGDAGCPEKSVFYFLKALKIRESQKKLIEAGYLYCNLAGFYFQPPYTNEGFKTVDKAIDLFRQARFPRGEGYAYNILGMTYFSRMDYARALNYYRKSLALNIEDTLTIRSGVSFTLTNIGDTWLKLKRFDSADVYYSRALRFSTRIQDNLPLACVYLSLGDLNTQQRKFAKAIDFINKGLYYSKLVNYRAQWEVAYNLLSECYDAAGDHKNALAYLKKRNEIKDSIQTEKAHQDVANMMIKYETQKKDEQISMLNIDSRNKQRKIRIAVAVILAILTLSGLLAYFSWFYYRKKLMPKVRDMNFIREKINIGKNGDNRKLRAIYKVLPPELKPPGFPHSQEDGLNKDLMGNLETLLIIDKIFLNENLSLAETAKKLDTNTSYLSRMINEHYQVNFSAFLNRYRIEEAKKMILDDKYNNFSMEGIAKSSGFRSKSTFNQAFKISTGLTPTEFAVKNGKSRT